jgi:hypothetical protein
MPMLTIATATVSGLLFTLSVTQLIYVFGYQKFLQSDDLTREQRATIEHRDANKTETIQAPAAIILCLRGVDPSLSDCLKGIVGQNYSNFQIHIVFDHSDDPAVEYVRNFFESQSIKPVMHFNVSPPKTCTLKCSSLVTAVNALPKEIEYVAFIDADAAADQNWLSDLLAPFADSSVGATTGNRWFTPHESNVGTIFRKIWNSAAAPQVILYKIGWGGSLAFRRDVIEQCDLLTSWRAAFCEDTMVADAFKPQGLTLHRVPSLIMENTESTTLANAFPWIVRQILTIRLHHRCWPMLLGHGVLTAIACYVTPLLIAVAWFTGNQTEAVALILFFLLYQTVNLMLLGWIDRCTRNVLNRRGTDPSRQSDVSGLGMNLVATLLNQFLFPAAVYQAATMRSVRWRGIDYNITSDNRIEMQQYVPYQLLSERHETESAESIY